MSEYWDLWCETCQVKITELGWNHGADDLLDLRASLPAIAAFEEHRQIGKWRTIDLVINQHSVSDAATHHAHDVRVRSQYGYDHDGCTERVTCECGAQHRCVLKLKHDGPCTRKAPAA